MDPDYSKTPYQICQDIWEQDAYKDAQYYGMLTQVLGLSRDPYINFTLAGNASKYDLFTHNNTEQ
ncbi:hypothetical protein MKX08_001049 [Trichoderma sp. CBMAI-0020]|nr:hypothetical protein MKX08_001049 [Trichoderma sp. CBMAI-0020]